MTFPFSLRLKERLKANVTTDNQQQILQYIIQSIRDKKAKNTFSEDLTVTYKGSTSSGRGSLLGSVDDGIFNLTYKDNSWWLIYQINLRGIFIGTGILAGIMESFVLLAGGPWWIGFIQFLWLCGGNWIIVVIRHESLLTQIAGGINEMVCGKESTVEKYEEKDERLKSWF
jgi:hypothetical protein